VTTATATSSEPSRWLLIPTNESRSRQLSEAIDCPLPIARLLTTRCILDEPAAREFLHPTLDSLHNPNLLLGMREAVARIQSAVRNEEPILIYGDYDVDGTTATVLLKTAIERVAPPDRPARVTYHVPHRIREGYGMQTSVLGLAADSGIRLVISVDTGIRAFAAVAEAKALGLDLIVTDHHLPDDDAGLPDALAVINPAQPNCPYPNKSLCGAAVAFKLSQALLQAHADASPDPAAAHRTLLTKVIPSFLKLVAIATIADSVPLTGENRAIAWLGLQQLANPVQPGLRALMQVAKIPLDRPPTATEVGFRLAPRINAAGRMDIAGDVVELFLTRDPARAQALAQKLDQLNLDRRATEAEALNAIEHQLQVLRQQTGGLAAECIILDHPDWHRGVLGILASRVVDRTGRPALILTHQDGSAHGSGRSIEGFHLLEALTTVNAQPDPALEGLFTRFGGHAHAVGFTLPSDRLDLLRARMRTHAAAVLTPAVLTPSLACHAELLLPEITRDLYDWLQRLAPFGNSAPEPLFFTRDLTLSAPIRIIKERHLCLKLCDSASSTTVEALGWSRSVDWLERAQSLALQPGSRVDAAYRLRSSEYQQTTQLQLELIDLRLHFSHPDSPSG
jgi:single-stranded-DNA-specific exonuclease